MQLVPGNLPVREPAVAGGGGATSAPSGHPLPAPPAPPKGERMPLSPSFWRGVLSFVAEMLGQILFETLFGDDEPGCRRRRR